MSSREEKPLGLNVGSASILMIFAVLCLTVFSALSLVTAISEKNTADHFAESTVRYYAADAEAIEIKEALLTSLFGAGAPQLRRQIRRELFMLLRRRAISFPTQFPWRTASASFLSCWFIVTAPLTM